MSTRFRRLFYEQPSLWRSLTVVEPQDGPSMRRQLEAKLALLQRVAPLVSAFRVEQTHEQPGSGWDLDGSGSHPPLSAFLQLLPSSLTALELDTMLLLFSFDAPPHQYQALPPGLCKLALLALHPTTAL